MDNETYIEKSLRGELTPKEKLEFAKKLASDKGFAEQWDWEQQVKKAVQAERRTAIKELLVKDDQKIKMVKWPVWLAAAAVILIGCFSYYFMKNDTPDYYTANYQKFPNLVAPNTRAEQTNKPIETAFKAYDNGDYIKARELFKAIEAVEPKAGFYKAMCLLELEEFTAAADELASLKFTDDFEAHRLWYLSLTYLKLNDNTRAIEILEKQELKTSAWAAQAAALLDLLKK